MNQDIIPFEDLADKLDLLPDAWVIEELTFDEIGSLPDEVIAALAECRLHNTIKAILITHDKRLFYVHRQPEFIDNVLSPDEQKLLTEHLTPTYLWGADEHVWEDALRSKENLFEPETAQQMVLQQFIPRRRIEGTIGAEHRNDYAAGTLLYFNQEFFGPGLYRTTSYPVTKLQDNRKIAQLVADAEDPAPGIFYL